MESLGSLVPIKNVKFVASCAKGQIHAYKMGGYVSYMYLLHECDFPLMPTANPG